MQPQRIPRPLGTTYLSLNLQKENTKDNKKKLRLHILKAFIQQQVYLAYTQYTHLKPKAHKTKKLKGTKRKPIDNDTNNKHSILSVENIRFMDLCLGLHLSPIKVQKRVERILALEAKGIDSKSNQARHEITTRATLNWALNEALNRYPTASQWAEELKAVARAYRYSPMNVKEANSALGQELIHLKAIFEMATKQLPQITKPSATINAQFNNGTMPENINGHYLTPTQAVALLEEKGLTNPEALDLNLIAMKHGLFGPDVKDVRAIPSDAQGVKAFDPKNFIYESHESRRAAELNVVDGTTDLLVIEDEA